MCPREAFQAGIYGQREPDVSYILLILLFRSKKGVSRRQMQYQSSKFSKQPAIWLHRSEEAVAQTRYFLGQHQRPYTDH